MKFPSPIGGMSIQTNPRETPILFLDEFPSPVGVMSIQTGIDSVIRGLLYHVSVPCRGYVYSDLDQVSIHNHRNQFPSPVGVMSIQTYGICCGVA